MDYLSELNEAQRAAVTSLDGPHMIIAGAGSGKTRVLTYRLAFIIDQGKADPFELLALTFTNKAAKEMKERIEKLIGPEARNIWMGTFHSIFARILRVEAEKIGYTRNFTILDEEDALSMVKKIIREMNLDDKTYKPKIVYHNISAAKNSLVDPIQFATQYVHDSMSNVVAKVYEQYDKRLFRANSMDFDDLLVKPIELFETDPAVLYKYQHRFRYIMIDEFQDTNQAQYVITRKLGDAHENICVVGDDAQSIYSFRGATIQNILNFKKDYPSTQVFKLEQNYRSTQNIVNAANSIIGRNKEQIQKNVFTENAEGDKIRILEAMTDLEEAKMVTDQIREQKMRHNYSDRDFAILYRTNAQSRSIETDLRRAGLKYRVFGGLSFYRRKEIKDIVAYLKLAVNPQDEASLTRIINYPTRGIGETTVEKVLAAAVDNGISFWEALQRCREWKLGARTEHALDDFVSMIKSFIAMARTQTAHEVALHIAKHTGILKDLHQDNDLEQLSRWENVQELLNAAKEFSENPDNDAHTLDAFLAEISLLTDADKEEEGTDYVTLMTIHSAKGLEFRSVFLVGMEEELFPSFMSMHSRADLEEERRLFYVAVTRACDRLTLTYAKSRYKYGSLHHNEPSRFLDEIGKQFIQAPQRLQKAEAASGGPAQTGNLPPMRFLKTTTSVPDDYPGDDLTQLAAGMEVAHPKFGQGKVLALDGNGPDRKATVFFTTKGQKVLLLKYAKMKILS